MATQVHAHRASAKPASRRTLVRLLPFVFLLASCDDHLFGASGHTPVVPQGDGWCAVQQVLASSCAGCHSSGAAAGGLDLQTDAHAALVGVPGSTGALLVDAGSPDTSLLIRKIEGTQAADEGGAMPPGSALSSDLTSLVRAWITDGADSACDEAPPPVTGGFHPDGWEAPDVHGLAAKFQQLDCRECHGDQLQGELGPACESCHGSGWETTCTFCHGGQDSTTGAPPEDIDDNTDVTLSPFQKHTQHLDPGSHAPIPCETCHTVPTSALTLGHFFDDDTPGRAEVRFSGLAAGGSWNGQSCGVYCHGDGQGPGSVDHASGPRQCSSCHPFMGSGEAALEGMSGEHEEHIDEGLACASCHSTATPAGGIAIPDQHVDGTVQVVLPAGMTRSAAGCTGTCHGETHVNRSW
ncbi:MAG: c-type cytochrome domain-containing protein [Myxococcota bacterium]